MSTVGESNVDLKVSGENEAKPLITDIPGNANVEPTVVTRQSRRTKSLTEKGREYGCNLEKSNRDLLYERLNRLIILTEKLPKLQMLIVRIINY